MPTTINGIGTQYYGRRNPRVYDGLCESCNRQVKLSDYETGHYFVVLFIPLVPLGKKQILSDCPVCRCHRAMPLREWEQLREESLESGMADLAQNMEDPAKAIDLLGRMTVFNQMDEALELAAATENQFSQDFDTLIDLGTWYEQQGRPAKADGCYNRAIELRPEHPISLRIQGLNAIQAGKPDDAAKHFETIRSNDEFYDPSLFFALGAAYQAAQIHDRALEEFRQLLAKVPDIGKDKEFRKAVKQSEKALGKSETILPKKGLFG